MVKRAIPDGAEEPTVERASGRIGTAARLIIQGRHRFYTLALPSDLLAGTCFVDPREENPIDGFQRVLDPKRAQEIADYIDTGFGTIPTSVVLSAQPQADMRYDSRTQVLNFRRHPRAFLILDGQHRVYGFRLANLKMRVPVVIYNNLRKSEEARLFIDINTKQRPVPNELLLDIKRMAETETDVEALMRNIFDLFNTQPDSSLHGQMNPSARRKGKISRVTFNTALRSIWSVFGENSSEYIYNALNAYIRAWMPKLKRDGGVITNPTLLRAIFLLFPAVAERLTDRYGDEYTVDRFSEILAPCFSRIKRAEIKSPGSSPVALHESFSKALKTGFAIGQTRAA